MNEQQHQASESHAPKLPLNDNADDEKFVSGLSTILVASIQETKDRISQIEYIFCTQLYPNLQSKSKTLIKLDNRLKKKESEFNELRGENRRITGEVVEKRRRIEELRREVDEGMVLQKSLVELVQSKGLLLAERERELKESEEKRKVAVARVSELEVKLREVEEGEELCENLRWRVSEIIGENSLVEQVESLNSELQSERMKRNRMIETYKRLKSQHNYLREKVGLTAGNMIHQNKLENGSDLHKHKSPITENGLAFDNPYISMDACEAVRVKSKAPEDNFGGLEDRTHDVFIDSCEINKMKENASKDDKGANMSPHSSSFNVMPKCPSSSKSVSVSGTKRPASSWRQTRAHQSRAGPDPHDDFLDTPLENIRQNLNKDISKEDQPDPIQKDISMNSSDDETQDLNAKCTPQKMEPSFTTANKRSFKYVEPVRKKAERENLKGVECKQCRKFYEAVLPNGDGKEPDTSKQNFRCEHLDGVSRHRYRYAPPMTPEGFWNIGFESEM
ncbi:PREDICTED: protein gamma response 1-like [Lupinus angustifolius]|uniref:protein gamma response 1-like n=1 Tax=Lupinus angustifolius TaxID=3871 RepID=UPI00092FC527|nr:PREDICTED: protein gamma response 1-like [Lupinus angustifolius]